MTLSKAKGEKDLVSLVMDKQKGILPTEMIKEIVSEGIIHFLFDSVLLSSPVQNVPGLRFFVRN